MRRKVIQFIIPAIIIIFFVNSWREISDYFQEQKGLGGFWNFIDYNLYYLIFPFISLYVFAPMLFFQKKVGGPNLQDIQLQSDGTFSFEGSTKSSWDILRGIVLCPVFFWICGFYTKSLPHKQNEVAPYILIIGLLIFIFFYYYHIVKVIKINKVGITVSRKYTDIFFAFKNVSCFELFRISKNSFNLIIKTDKSGPRLFYGLPGNDFERFKAVLRVFHPNVIDKGEKQKKGPPLLQR